MTSPPRPATWPRRCWPRQSEAAPASTGGAILLALIAAVAFATILAVVAGLTLTSAPVVAHDLYDNVIKQGQGHREAGGPGGADRRRSSSAAVAILLAIPAQKLNVAFLVALAFAVAASANLPSIVYNLFWRRFNTRGAVWSIYGGLITWSVLVDLLPIMSGGLDPVTGKNLSLLPTGSRLSWFPLENPGIISIPLGFLFGWLGTVTSRESRRPRSATTSSRCARSPARARRRPSSTDRPVRYGARWPSRGQPGANRLPTTLEAGRPCALGWPTSVNHQFWRDRERRDPGQPGPRGPHLRAAGRRWRPTPTSRRRPTTGRRRTGWRSGPRQPSGSTGARSGTRSSTGRTRPSPSGSSAAPSTPRSTASTGTSRPATATRSRCTGWASPRTTPAT